MHDNLKDSLLTVCKLLEKHNVRYLLIGGTAVALNGHYRLSVNTAGELTEKPDIDIWYNSTYENYFSILKVIEELGNDISDLKSEKNPDPKKSFFKLDFDDFTLDILPKIKADITFNDANRRKDGSN